MREARYLSAYFTVEAALIMPIVLMITLFVIYMMFFQYDRCLMEQDVGRLLVRGVVTQAENGEQRVRQMSVRAKEIYKEKYLLWESEKVNIKQEKGKVTVSQSGMLCTPYAAGRAEVKYENGLLEPVSFVRNCRKIIKLLENQ